MSKEDLYDQDKGSVLSMSQREEGERVTGLHLVSTSTMHRGGQNKPFREGLTLKCRAWEMRHAATKFKLYT